MLTKDLLRVSRAGGGYHPQFADREHRPLAARVIGTYQGHVGESRAELEAALTALERGTHAVPDNSSGSPREREADDFKLVRGLSALLEREATFETDAEIEPERARRAAFEAAEAVGVVTEDERTTALVRASDSLDVSADELETALYADLEERQILTAVEPRWDPDGLIAQYNLSLAQTALFDATEVRVRSSDPKALISTIKRLRLMYEIRRLDGESAESAGGGSAVSEREVVVTGPTRLFRATRRYGTRFARLLRTVAKGERWSLEATIDDRGTERTLALSDEDPIRVPDAEPIADVTFDSNVEADFAARFSNLDLDWTLVREPEPLATGTRVMIPDFAFEYDPTGTGRSDSGEDGHSDFRLYFEIMGFWTPEYVAKKLSQLGDLEDVDMLVAVDESLGVGEEIAARDHRAIPYSGTVRVKDVADVLREYERQLVAESAARLPDELRPDEAVISLETLAATHGVSTDALADAATPEHERVGRTLIRPTVIESLAEEIEPGMDLAEAEAVLEEYDIADSSAVLSRLGYRVEWDGLAGGVLADRE